MAREPPIESADAGAGALALWSNPPHNHRSARQDPGHIKATLPSP